MKERNRNARGSAAIMVTLALVPMCGLMGLAVDLGWSFFLKRQAQATTDAAALAAAAEAMNDLGGNFVGVTCNQNQNICGSAQCTGANANPPMSGPLASGCVYANNYSYAFNAGQPNVTIEANIGPPPTIYPSLPSPPTDVLYWVTVISTQNVPQLFSAVLGNLTATVSASSTAAIVPTIPGQLVALNGPNDCIPNLGGCGIDLNLGGSVTTAGGVILSSPCTGAASPCTGVGSTASSVAAEDIQVPVQGTTSGTFTPLIVNPGGPFADPTLSEAQPPPLAPNQNGAPPLPTCAIANFGLLQSGVFNLGPFSYYATDNMGNPFAAGITIPAGANVTFSAGGGCPGLPSGPPVPTTFPSYFFYGGLNLLPTSNTTFGPGEYVMVGAYGGGSVFTLSGNVTGDNTMGTMFILTAPNSNYPQLAAQTAVTPAVGGLAQGPAAISTGASGQLYGVSSSAPAPFSQYSGVLFWQDRQNTLATSSAFNLADATISGTGGASALSLTGALYQPEGAYVSATGSSVASPFQIITGGIVADTSTSFTLTQVTNPMLRYIVALIK